MCLRRFRGLTIVELLVIVAIAGVFLFLATINFGYFRGNFPNSRLVCGSNLKGIGLAAKIYANDNDGLWPVPSFDESAIGLIDYTVRAGGGEGSVRSPSRSQPSSNIQGGARQLSVTRAFWMLVRSGEFARYQSICPASGDTRDETASINSYYDFTGYRTVSYGYQVPFGPTCTRAR